MDIDKESILRHYRQMGDEEFSMINPEELTDYGRLAYKEEKIRRSSTEYIQRKAEETLARDTANKISAEKREAKKASYSKAIAKAGLIIIPIFGIVSGVYCLKAVNEYNRSHDMGLLQWWGFANFWGLMLLQIVLKKFKLSRVTYIALYVVFLFTAIVVRYLFP
jgi:hypothetical protein